MITPYKGELIKTVLDLDNTSVIVEVGDASDSDFGRSKPSSSDQNYVLSSLECIADFQGLWTLVSSAPHKLRTFKISGRLCLSADCTECYLSFCNDDQAVDLAGSIISLDEQRRILTRDGLQYQRCVLPLEEDLDQFQGMWYSIRCLHTPLSISHEMWKWHGMSNFLVKGRRTGTMILTDLGATIEVKEGLLYLVRPFLKDVVFALNMGAAWRAQNQRLVQSEPGSVDLRNNMQISREELSSSADRAGASI